MRSKIEKQAYLPSIDKSTESKSPWDPLQGETDTQYACFLLYRDMGAGERSVNALVDLLAKKVATGEFIAKMPSRPVLQDWAWGFRWADRVLAWDLFLRRERDVSIIAMARQEGEREAEAAQKMLSSSLLFYDELISRFNKAALRQADLRTLIAMWPNANKAVEAASRILRLLGREPTELLGIQGSMIFATSGPIDVSRMGDNALATALEIVNRGLQMKEAETKTSSPPEDTVEGSYRAMDGAELISLSAPSDQKDEPAEPD